MLPIVSTSSGTTADKIPGGRIEFVIHLINITPSVEMLLAHNPQVIWVFGRGWGQFINKFYLRGRNIAHFRKHFIQLFQRGHRGGVQRKRIFQCGWSNVAAIQGILNNFIIFIPSYGHLTFAHNIGISICQRDVNFFVVLIKIVHVGSAVSALKQYCDINIGARIWYNQCGCPMLTLHSPRHNSLAISQFN